MLLPNAWFSKIGLLAVGALLWSGGAQAGTSLQSLSEATSLKSLSEGPFYKCTQIDYLPCLIQYYALPTDLSGELVETGPAGQNIPLSDNPQGSEMSPRLEKVMPILAIEKLGGFVQMELYKLHAPADATDKKKKEVSQRWAAFEFMLNRLDLENSGKETVFGYRQEDVSLKSTFRDIDEQLDSSLSKESNLRELIIRWTNFMLPMAATLAALGLVWAGFLYITSFQDESRLEEAKKVILMVIVGVALVGGSYAIVSTIVTRVF